jgi:minor extracellular serine protease Vpr
MRLSRTRIAVALTLAFGILGSTPSGAAKPEAVDSPSASITPAWTPPGLNRTPVTVVLQMQGDTVAERQGAAGRKLSAAEKGSIKSSLKSRQDGLRKAIESRGGAVLATYQVAYNGIKVRIARDKLASLASLPGVVAVRPLQLQKPDNVRGVPMIGAPTVWQNLGFHGEGVKVAIIDTGIDYTHATFGGPGTAAAYASAHAAETAPANPAYFGPGAPRVKGGIDLVGDSYNADPGSATYQPIPHPDANPLDCNGHGSHVAGTAAGSGVTSAGATYTGPYDSTTLATPSNFIVGPGVAPKADLYAIRVFGCAGSTDVTVDAIEWAVDNDMDVINMSLGAPFGTADDPSAAASTNAAKAGVVVVASAGNSGANQYLTGSPATGDGAISVAASDPTPSFPGALINLAPAIQSINANDAPLPSGALAIKVLRTASGAISLGCDPNEYVDVTNKIVVTARGTCARVARAVFGQQHGAAAVVMVNTDNTYPPFEGKITGNPDTGEQYNVTIPFLGVFLNKGAQLNAANGTSTTLTANTIVNPTYQAFGSFSSGGPRTGDSHLKPEVTAPGVSIVSTAVGSGNGAATLSGTSMAAPHTAGVAALTRQAHPTWKAEDIKAAIVNTGSPAGVVGYRTSRGGTGLVQPVGSTATQVVAHPSGSKFGSALDFGFAEFKTAYSKTLTVTLHNNGGSAATFSVAQARAAGRPHTLGLGSSAVTVPAGGDATVSVTLNVPQGTAGSSIDAGLSFKEVAGLVEFTPQAGGNGGVTLRVPYYLVPRAQSEVSTTLGRLTGTNPSAVATVSNRSSAALAGTADFYAWGLSAPRSSDPASQYNDVRAVGVQSFPDNATSTTLVFAVSTWNRWSSPSSNEFDIYVDVDGDGAPDYVVVGVDQGAVTTGEFNGRLATFVFSTRSAGASLLFFASAPTDSSTALLPVLSSQLCRSGEPCLSGGRIAYQIVSFDLVNGGAKEVAAVAKFHPWNSAVSTGGFAFVAPGTSDTSNTISVNSAEQAVTPALGVMVVTPDNKAGADEAQLIPLR